MSRTEPRRSNLDVARTHAGIGLFVFPAIVSWNERAKKLDKKPAITGWREAATTDPAQFLKWWDEFPNAVPGIELGYAGYLSLISIVIPAVPMVSPPSRHSAATMRSRAA
jgi:hypothetical protein